MRAKLTSFLSILCLLMVFAAAVQAAPAGKVTNLEGRADLTAPGQPAKALLIGDTVNVGDILRTKSGSKLEVTWIDGSIARLSENSRLKVTEFTLGVKKRSTILSLFRGKVQNVVTGATQLFGEKDGSRYEIHTPTSVCGVRGTVFFIYHENGVSGALFTEGKGFMYSKGQPGNVKPVAPGVMMIVTSANKPPEAKPAKPGDATKLFNATNPSEKKKDDKKGEEKKEGATGGGTSGTGGTTAASGKDESTGTTKTEDTGGTAGTTETTGTGDTGSGTTGTGGTTTMLGGDPTASTPPATVTGSVAGNILTGSTAGTTGIAGTTGTTTTQTTNPVTPVVVPVIEPTPTGTTTTFTQDVTQGTISGKLTGSISDKTNTGTLNLAGTGMESIYVVPTTGSLSDGSTDNAYLAGIPGSWRGLFIGLSRKDTSVSLLSGSFLSGAYTDQTLNAAGSIARSAGYTISSKSTYDSFPNLPLLVLQNVSIGEAFDDPVIYGPTSGDVTTDGIMGYNTSAGGILGIWGAQTLNGAYINATGDKSKTVNLYHYTYYPDYQDPGDHFAFGSAVITDDLLGHTTVKSSSLTYLDRNYLGTLSLDYRGVYNFAPETTPTTGVSYPYSSIGTGVYNLQPLAWSGDWGRNQYNISPESLYENFYNEQSQVSFMQLVAHDMGLAGGVAPFWTGASRMTALGYLVDDGGTPVTGETVAGPLLWNSGIAAQALTGATVEDIFTPDAEFAGFTAGVWKDGLMKGSAYAIYKTAAGQAGWLIGKDTISGLYDSEIGLWKAEGDLTPTPKFAALYPELTADLEVFHDIAFGITGGSFGGQGSILNQFSILQTTFYGKGIYDEEGYLDKVLPLRWGIYDLRTASGNAFSGKPAAATSWTAKIGGYGPTQMNAPFFYLADINGTWKADGTIDGQLLGNYMTPLYLGVLSGPFYGLYTEGEVSGNGGWVGQSVGTYNVTQKLAHSASWGGGSIFGYYADEGVLLTDSSGQMYEVGYAAGILGGTTTPWSSSTAISAMGLFSVYDNTEYKRASYLWNAALAGSVPKEINETPTAGGIYAGYSAALWRADNFTGAIRTLYLTPPDATTGKSTAGFLTGDSIAGTIYNLVQDRQEYDGYVETYTVGLWESTGTNTLTASTPVATGLDPEAVTLAGGSMNAKLSGTFGGAGALTNDAAWGDFTFFMNGAIPLPFGVYDLKLGSGDPGGIFSGKPTGATSWTAKIGGAFNYEPAYEYGYWLADVGGQWNAAGEITGNVSNGTYLTPTQMGILSGPFYGLYTEGETPDSGTWVGQSIGNYEGKNLAFVSDIYPSLRYWDGSAWQYASLSISGLLGGTDSLWDSSVSAPVSISALGSLYLYGTPNSNGNIFSASTASHNYKDIAQVNTTYDGGAYYLFYGGRERSETLEANIAGLYIYDGKAGFLRGNLDGDVFSQIGVWEASGSIYKEEKDTTGILAENLQDNLWWGGLTGNISSEGGSLSGAVGFNYGATLYDKNGGTNWIMNGGIWQADLGGSYRGTIETPWTARVGGQGVFGPYFDGGGFAPDSGYWLAGITGSMWSDDNLSADVTGSYITSVNLGTMSGKLLGTYDANYWQAAAVGTHEGTPLAYSTQVYLGHWGYYDTTPGLEGLVHDMYPIAGLTGGINSLFSGEADVTGMGTYTRNENSPLFAMLLVNANGGPETNPFHIYYGGSRVPAYEDYPEWFEGKMAGFYARNWDGAKYNEIGLLTSGPLMIDGEPRGLSVWGDVYPEIGMWEIPVDEGQGTLMHTAKTGTVSSLSIEESDWSPAAKVEGDFQGTMRMKSAHIAGIEDWGAWIAAAGGPSPAEISEDGTWTSTTGWKETNASGKASYSIASVDGYTYGDGGFWAGVSGRFLNPDN
ncbi:MAG TPA: FecR family protein, partial [Smithellaceae bacterium]|nr:FecR family protein [Smithellaceae bacterium]